MMLTNFLIFCSGADRGMISQCPKSEANKYASIGATVFLTGFLAAISSGYALYTIFRGEEYAMIAALCFGVVWATIIFNLDRYIVSSLRKEGNWKRELLYATPRFIIAILISLVIAKPLEVRIFASRIEQQILEDKRQKLKDEKLWIDQQNDLTKLENTVQGQSSELGTLDSLRQGDPTSEDFKKIIGDRNLALQDLNSVSKSNNPLVSDYNFKISQIKGNASNYREKKDSTGKVIDRKLLSEANKSIGDLSYSRNVLLNEIKAKQKRVENLDAEIQKLRNDYKAIMAQRINEKEAEMAQTKQTKAQADSIAKNQFDESVKVKERSYTNNFITQVEALGNLNSKTFSTMWWTSILIMLLFVTIETAPIIVKLLSKRGPYDELLERVEYEHYLEQQKIISDKNDEINNLLVEIQAMNKLKGEVRMKTEKSKLDAELQSNTALLNEIATKQADLAKLAIDKWYNDELSNFKSNPNNQYAQTKQQVKPASIEDKLWKADNLQGEIFYLFKNGQPTNNELVYMEGGKTEKGSWEYLTANKEIRVNILSNTETYTIEDITETSAKLKTATNDYLELTKV
jgi:hypothetical protein